MKDSVQISAIVSRTTKQLLDREARETGVKLGHLIETALRHHLQALHDVPADVMIPARLVVTGESWDAITQALETPGNPTPSMRTLMAAEPGATHGAKSETEPRRPSRARKPRKPRKR